MKKLYIPLFGLLIMLASCATTRTTVLNNTDGSYTMEATDRTEADALNGGVDKANELCQKQGKRSIVLSHVTKYTGGMDQNLKGALSSAASITSLTSGTHVTGPDTSQDYMVTLKYKCE